jgi:LSD1 subclass zinc finger protein
LYVFTNVFVLLTRFRHGVRVVCHGCRYALMATRDSTIFPCYVNMTLCY